MTKLLITGGAGFIGHHIVKRVLASKDWDIVLLDRLDYSGNLNRIDHLLKTEFNNNPDFTKRVKFVFHDLKGEINPLIAGALGDVNIIFHLAAGSHVDRSISNPLEFVMDNTVGTCNLLNYARTLPNLEKFLYFSTDEVFGPAPVGINYQERDRYNSTNPYSASKAGAEELCVAFENTYKLPIVITHTMNVVGERQHPEKFVPMVIRKVLNSEIITIHANKEKTKAGSRFYIHAQDVADALLFIIEKQPTCPSDFGGAHIPKFNIVGSEELDNLQLAEIIAKSVGKSLKYEFVDFHSQRPGHDLRYALSGELLKEQGWQPNKTIANRIDEIVQWYLKNPEWLQI